MTAEIDHSPETRQQIFIAQTIPNSPFLIFFSKVSNNYRFWIQSRGIRALIFMTVLCSGLNSRNGLCSGWMRNQERVKQTDNRWPKSQRPGNPKWHIWAPSKQQFRAATEEILTESDVCLYFWNSVLPIFCNIYFFCNSTNETSPPNTVFFAKIHLKRGVVFYWSRCQNHCICALK